MLRLLKIINIARHEIDDLFAAKTSLMNRETPEDSDEYLIKMLEAVKAMIAKDNEIAAHIVKGHPQLVTFTQAIVCPAADPDTESPLRVMEGAAYLTLKRMDVGRVTRFYSFKNMIISTRNYQLKAEELVSFNHIWSLVGKAAMTVLTVPHLAALNYEPYQSQAGVAKKQVSRAFYTEQARRQIDLYEQRLVNNVPELRLSKFEPEKASWRNFLEEYEAEGTEVEKRLNTIIDFFPKKISEKFRNSERQSTPPWKENSKKGNGEWKVENV